MTFKHIPLEKIITKDNIRSEADDELGGLVDSIERYDIIQPILVMPEGEKFIVVTGHRRFTAMKARNEATIPCIIRDDIAKSDRVWIQLVENSQRKNLSALEYVEIFDTIKRHHKETTGGKLTDSHLGVMIGRSGAWVHGQYEGGRQGKALIDSGMPRNEVEPMTAGQIRHRVSKQRRKGDWKTGSVESVFSIQRAGLMLRIRCSNKDVLQQVKETLKTLRREMKIEATPAKELSRDADICELIKKGAVSSDVAESYGITRSRVCQIVRTQSAVDHHQGTVR